MGVTLQQIAQYLDNQDWSYRLDLEDLSLTERQFNRCLDGLIQIVDRMAIPRLKEVMKTGQDPANIDMGKDYY